MPPQTRVPTNTCPCRHVSPQIRAHADTCPHKYVPMQTRAMVDTSPRRHVHRQDRSIKDVQNTQAQIQRQMTHGSMTIEEEMEWLEGDLTHLMEVQNRVGSDVDFRGFPENDMMSEQIGRLERVWGQMFDRCA
jgi:hypothetical protein